MADSLSHDELIRAFHALNGTATWEQLRQHIAVARNDSYEPYKDDHNYDTTLRQTLYRYCPGFEKFTGNAIFDEIEQSRFRLIGHDAGYDAGTIDDHESSVRRSREISEYKRDPKLVRLIKAMYNGRCQVCGEQIILPSGQPYAEAHHIQGLGNNGPDSIKNMLCVCSNCHALLDLKAIQLTLAGLKHLHLKHRIDQKYLDYHNRLFAKRWNSKHK